MSEASLWNDQHRTSFECVDKDQESVGPKGPAGPPGPRGGGVSYVPSYVRCLGIAPALV